MGEVEEVSPAPISSRPGATTAPILPILAPASRLHSPSLSRYPLLSSSMRETVEDGPTTSRIPPERPVGEVLNVTKQDPRDAWLPITESRKGSALSAAFHVLCSGIGIQALILPFAFTALGWAWGIVSLTVVFTWQLYTLYLLVHLHESTETGLRYSRYLQLFSATLGDRLKKILAVFPILYLSGGTCVAMISIGGSMLKLLFETWCGATNCSLKPLTLVEWYLVLTCAAIVAGQPPNLNSMAGVSLVGAITAVGYCTMIWVVSMTEARLPDAARDLAQAETRIASFFSAVSALGIVAFVFRGHNVILEIQATMPSTEEQPSHVPMWMGVKFAYLLIALCCFPLATAGYWAYGHQIPEKGGILKALHKFHAHDASPFILGLISLFLVINAVCAFQIYGMPAFDDMEAAYISFKKKPCPWWLRSIFRAVFGLICFFIAVALPFLGSLDAVVAGIALPVTLAYPCFMWIEMKKPKAYSLMWWLNWGLGVSGMCLSGIVTAAGVYVSVNTGIQFNFFTPH